MLKTIQNIKSITLEVIELSTIIQHFKKKKQGRITLNINYNNKEIYVYDRDFEFKMKGF